VNFAVYISKWDVKVCLYKMILRSILAVLFLAAALNGFSQSIGDEGSELSYSSSEHSDPREDIRLYPNPAPDYLYVRLGRLESSKVKLAVHNIIGNELNPEVETIDDHQMRLRVKDMAPGYYFLSVKDEGSKFRGIFKFLKP
jgi:Secretion system C-terminal sorting domain